MLNQIKLCGTIIDGPEYSYRLGNKKFYKGKLLIMRLSGIADHIPFVCQEAIAKDCKPGDQVRISGQVRTRNYTNSGKVHLDVFVYARRIDPAPGAEDLNEVAMEGIICHAAGPREVGSRTIAVIKLANNEANKTNYIPCVLWGHQAAQDWICGDFVTLSGRLQSRDYIASDGRFSTTYELSVISAKRAKCCDNSSDVVTISPNLPGIVTIA